MPVATEERTSPRTGAAVRSLLIVARGQPELFRALQQAVGESSQLLVLVDRRGMDRRVEMRAVPEDRRRRERRGLPHLAEDLRLRQYILTRPLARRPQDWRLTPDR